MNPADDIETRLRKVTAERDALAALLAEALNGEAQRIRSVKTKAPWFRETFQPKHGTAERWNICDCADCVAAKPA